MQLGIKAASCEDKNTVSQKYGITSQLHRHALCKIFQNIQYNVIVMKGTCPCL